MQSAERSSHDFDIEQTEKEKILFEKIIEK
jgi:hypothetical protein